MSEEIKETVNNTDAPKAEKENRKEQDWNRVQEYMDQKTALTVTIKGVVNKGVIAYVEGIRGFIPASKLSTGFVENLEDWLEKEVDVQVITVDQSQNKLVLSARELQKQKEAAENKEKMERIQVGEVLEGTVDKLMPYGAFIALDNGLSGLVHISQISERRIREPKDVLSVGDKVSAKIIGLKEGKLSLSLRDMALAVQEEQGDENYSNYKMPASEAASTKLGDLLKSIKL